MEFKSEKLEEQEDRALAKSASALHLIITELHEYHKSEQTFTFHKDFLRILCLRVCNSERCQKLCIQVGQRRPRRAVVCGCGN